VHSAPTVTRETAASEPSTPAAPSRRLGARLVRVLRRPWLHVLGISIALTVSFWSFDRVPNASWEPAMIGLLPWAIGKYLLCPLRWHALSMSGRSRRWHLRIYAESELLGLASPGHVGADIWRMHRLQTGAEMTRTCSIAEVALDRLIGALGLTAFVLVSGATLPPQIIVAAVGIALGFFVLALVIRRRRPDLLAGRPMPAPRVVIKGALLSMGYQLTIMGLLIGTVAAMGEQVHPMALLGVFGASQVAGILPGVNGASPREGALVVGLASVGVTWQAALGAVALTAVLAWVPALLIGGAAFAVRKLRPLTAV
jgi:glycosyltransferase 2 family protein